MKPKDIGGADLRASIWLLLAAVLVLTAARSDAQTPSWYPSWWSSYGVISGTTPADYGAANQGEAKNIAVAAVNELDNDIPQFGGAGAQLDLLATTLLQSDSNGHDYSAIDLGQMKALAQPFYDRLMALGYFGQPLIVTGTSPATTGTYPWGGGTANDYAMGNIGQLKHLFSFDVNYTSPANTSGIPDWWVNLYYPGLIASGSIGILNGYVAWSDSQVTIFEAYENGWNPNDFYNGQASTLSIVSGSGQIGTSGSFVSSPLIVSVTGSGGNPLYGAPVTFTVTTGSLQTSSTASPVTTQTTLADSNGEAQIYYQLPPVNSSTNTITVTTGTGADAATPVTFTEYSDNGSGTYVSPFAPSDIIGAMNADGSETITWQNNDNASPIYVYLQVSGTWEVTGTLTAGTTTCTVSGSEAGSVEIGNNYSPGGSTGNPGGGGGGAPIPPGGAPFASIPVQNYAAIDMSGTYPNGNPVNLVALDDNNNAAFESVVLSGSTTGGIATGTCNVCTWVSGTVTALSPFSTVATASMTNVSGSSISVPMGLVPVNLLANGEVFGNGYAIDNTLAYSESGGAVSWTALPSPYEAFSFYGYDLTKYFTVSPDGSSQALAGSYVLSLESPVNESTGAGADFIVGSGTAVAFSPNSPYSSSGATVTNTNQYFQSYAINANGWALGVGGTTSDVLVTDGTDGVPSLEEPYTAYQIWNGSGFTSFFSITDAPVAINNANEVIVASDSGDYLWTNGICPLTGSSGAQPIVGLIPQQYRSEISNICAVAISDTDSNGWVRILLNAQYTPAFNARPVPGTFVLTLTGSGNPLSQVSLPADVAYSFSSNSNNNQGITIMNAKGLIAGIGNITTGTGSAAVTGTSHALLLVPVNFNVTSWSPTITTPGIVYEYDPNNNNKVEGVFIASFSNPNENTFMLDASTTISIPGLSGALGNSLASQWDIILYQNLVEEGGDLTQYKSYTWYSNMAPIPGDDTSNSDSPPTELPQLQAYSQNNQSINISFADSPNDIFVPLWFTHADEFDYSDPLESDSRDDEFITWIYAHNRVTNQFTYLKWIRWHVEYDVDFDFTEAPGYDINIWEFYEVSEGDGMGAFAPVHVPINNTTPAAKPNK